MNEKIALGFHTCVDYELVWDTQTVEEQIRAFDIHADELKTDMEIESQRDIWIVSLAHMMNGKGCEIIPCKSELCVDFANHFDYKITLGGTPTRAAIILAGLGYSSILQTGCYNEYVEKLMPEQVRVLPGPSGDYGVIFPHVVLQYFGGVRIHANDIDFVTPRENRILISRDIDSLNMPVLDKEFGQMIGGCQVFLLGSFSEIIDMDILKDRMEKTKRLLSHLPENSIVVMEDGHYVKEECRHYVHKRLAPQIDILSMNEDELQQYTGNHIDILDSDSVAKAVEHIHKATGIKRILVHTAAWAMVYGDGVTDMKTALESGVITASTRFRLGDNFTISDYEQTKSIQDNAQGAAFCDRTREILGDKVCCIPGKDLRDVKNPTAVGLGDTFAGGLLIGLLNESKD